MRIYFVRHGESEANLLQEFSNRGWKHGLTPKGFEQAQTMIESLDPISIARIYTSPLKRAVETAQVFSIHTGVAYQVTDALREFDTGINEGLRDSESWKRWEIVMADWRINDNWESKIEGGESLVDMLDRFIPFVEKVRATYRGRAQNLLLVGHGGLFISVLPHVLINIRNSDIKTLDFPNTGFVLAEDTPEGLLCREWCGTKYHS